MELKALAIPKSCQITAHKETEQAQTGYEEIRETQAIPDLPRIMPGYQNSLSSEDCHSDSEDRENFLCPISDLQPDDDCCITEEKTRFQEKISSCPIAAIFPVSQSSNVQTNSLDLTPASITATEDHHSTEQQALVEKRTVDLTSDMCNSKIETSDMTEKTQSMQLMEATSFPEHCHTGLVHLTSGCQNHAGSRSPGVSKFCQAHDTLIPGSETLGQDRPGPKPPDLACCYPKKFRYRD